MPNIFGSSVWNLLCITLLAPQILKQFLDISEICAPWFNWFSHMGSKIQDTHLEPLQQVLWKLCLIIGRPPYPRVIHSNTYRGYVKLWIIPNAIYNWNCGYWIHRHGGLPVLDFLKGVLKSPRLKQGWHTQCQLWCEGLYGLKIVNVQYNISIHLSGFVILWHVTCVGCWWRRWPPNMEGGCSVWNL